MKRLILIKKLKIYLLLFTLLSINSLGQNAVNENHMIIKFDQNSTFTFSASSVGCSFVTNIDCINAELWCVPDVLQIGNDQYVGEQAIADYFASMGGIVEYAEPDWLLEEFSTPNDPFYNQLWGMNKINAPQAWDVQTGNSSVIVGVIDSGVDWTHPDLIDNIWQNMGEDADGDGSIFEWNGSQWIFDPGDENGIDDDGNGYVDDFVGWDFHENDNDPYDICGHGTHVAGTIGAKGNNNTGVSGVCWDVQLMALKFLELNPLTNKCEGETSNSILALDYAVMNGAPITNNSYGGGSYSQAMHDALEVARQNNHLFVAAAGNNGFLDNDIQPKYPASYDNENIISIANTTSADGIASSSHYGLTTVDLGAPGTGVYSTIPNNNYASYSGTSMAAPHLAGAAALLLSECNSLTYQEIKTALMDATDPIPALSGKCVTGGRLNVNAAMQSLPSFNCAPLRVCRTTDSLALVALYNSTNGPNWTNTWNLSQPLDNWYGVTLSGDGCSVTKMELASNNLAGSLPTEIGNLLNLTTLFLQQNQLGGNIPNQIGNLNKLTLLRLDNNQFSGNIPSEIGNLDKLIILYLSFNQLNGNIPSTLGNLVNLQQLSLNNNQLTGVLPSSLENLIVLANLRIHNNQLTGNIPSYLGNFTNIYMLILANNQFSGNIPSSLVNLSNITHIDLSGNQLTGSIPDFSIPGNIVQFYFHSNQLSGCYPQSLCNLDLTYYNFHNNPNLPDSGSKQGFQDFCAGNAPCNNPNTCMTNDSLALVALYNSTDGPNWTNTWDLSQPVSSWYGVTISTDSCNVTRLDLDDNNLTGSIPSEIGNLYNLTYLSFHTNQLSGNIPSEIGNLYNLRYLYLWYNQLIGNIPSEIGYLNNLIDLRIQNNQLSGELPTEIGDITNLEILLLGNNELTGTIPHEIGNLHKLILLYLQYNQLSGNIPSTMGNLINLQQLSLNNNQLTGSLPSSLENLTVLANLRISSNQFIGNIPSYLGTFNNLYMLILANNQFSGNIPSSLGNLSNITHIDVSSNQLTGSIPNFSIPGNIVQFYFHSNQLSGCYPQSLCNLDLTYYNFHNNPNLPDGGSSQGFQDFCAGTAPPCGGPYCNAYELNLGPDVSLSCGGSVTLSTGLTNMALTLWDYEGTLVGDTSDITVNAPGTYVAVVADSCGNTGIDTIMVNQSGDCVWPGDMNKDNIVNVNDVLSWGLDNGKTGPVRSGGNFDWIGQACANWSTFGPNGVNDKHSDASGNGTVSVNDLNAITQNYGKVHGSTTPPNGNFINSFIAASNVNMFNAAGANNGEIILDLVLSEPISDVHGLAWSIDLNFSSDIKDISFVHNSDWFGTEGSNLKVFYHYEAGYNKIDVAITRTDGQLVSGDGLIGHLVITEDNVIPWDDPDYNISIDIDKAVKIDNQGNLTYLGNNSNGLVAAAGGACPTFHLHNYNNYVDGYYQAENQITSSATIGQTAVVDYKAGDQFTINPGFNVVAGGEFKATIEPCTAFKGPSPKVINNKFIEINFSQDQVLPTSLHPIDNELIEAISEELPMKKGDY